jgi:hypothetical protein
MKGETMTTVDEQNVQGADTLGSVRQRLLDLGKAALAQHPLLMAMATQIRVIDPGTVWFTFDSPALPEKQNCEVLLPPDLSAHPYVLAAFMNVCEDQLAAAMRKAGLAWASPSVVGRGGGGASGGNPDTHGQGGCGPIYSGGGFGGVAGGGAPYNTTCGDGAACGGSGNVAQGGGSGSACESEPSFHGDGRVD